MNCCTTQVPTIETCEVSLTHKQSESIWNTINFLVSSGIEPAKIISAAEKQINSLGIDNTSCLVQQISSILSVTWNSDKSIYLDGASNDILYYTIGNAIPLISYENNRERIYADNDIHPNTGGYVGGERYEIPANINKMISRASRDSKNRLSMLMGIIAMLCSGALWKMLKTIVEFLFRLAVLVERLFEKIYARLMKIIGTAQKTIARIMKAIKDMYQSAINLGLVAGETMAGHMSKALQDALSIMGNVVTDIVNHIGDFIENMGQLWDDISDTLHLVKTIAEVSIQMQAMIEETMGCIKQIYNDIVTLPGKLLEAFTSELNAWIDNAKRESGIGAAWKELKSSITDPIRGVSRAVSDTVNDTGDILEPADESVDSTTLLDIKYGENLSPGTLLA